MSDLNYPSNSNSQNKPEPEKKELKQIVNAVEKKETMFSRIRRSFVQEDAHSVGQYLVFDVLIPAAKATLEDLVTQGLGRGLWGSGRPRSSSTLSTPQSRGSYTSYGSLARPAQQVNQPRDFSDRARASHDFREIVLATRADAESVIQALLDPIEQYGWASVGDLYKLVGIMPSFQDEKWGWDNLVTAGCRPVSGGYILEFPKPTYQE